MAESWRKRDRRGSFGSFDRTCAPALPTGRLPTRSPGRRCRTTSLPGQFLRYRLLLRRHASQPKSRSVRSRSLARLKAWRQGSDYDLSPPFDHRRNAVASLWGVARKVAPAIRLRSSGKPRHKVLHALRSTCAIQVFHKRANASSLQPRRLVTERTVRAISVRLLQANLENISSPANPQIWPELGAVLADLSGKAFLAAFRNLSVKITQLHSA